MNNQANNKQLTTTQAVTSLPSPQFATTIRNATSLEMPSLYSNVRWEELPNKSRTDTDGINRAMAFLENGDSLFIPFTKGFFWKTTSPIEYPSIESYYSEKLKKEGWDTDADKLQFDNFNLQSIIADGMCEGVIGYMGYKDGMVRLIAVQRKLISCGPLGSPEDTPSPRNAKPLAQYTIFISDPIPIEQIEQYIRNHPIPKGS